MRRGGLQMRFYVGMARPVLLLTEAAAARCTTLEPTDASLSTSEPTTLRTAGIARAFATATATPKPARAITAATYAATSCVAATAAA